MSLIARDSFISLISSFEPDLDNWSNLLWARISKSAIKYNFNLVESPDPDLSENDRTLHGVIARILEDIIERGEKEGWVKLNERKEINEFTDRADHTSKIIN